VLALGFACAWGIAMLVVFRSVAIERFTVPPGVRGSLASTVRAVAGLGPAVALLGLVGALLAWRAPRAEDRVLAVTAILAVAAYAVGGVAVAMQPRYLLVLQPVLMLVAARAGGAVLARLSARPALAHAVLLGFAAPGLLSTAWYFRGRGGRDVERPVHAAVVEAARPGDAVLWDVPRLDPFGFRPRAPRPVPPSHDVMDDPAGLERLWADGVRFVVRSSTSADRPLWTAAARARLEPVASSTAATSPAGVLLGEGAEETVTLYRIRP
jgi:hypothetical protein